MKLNNLLTAIRLSAEVIDGFSTIGHAASAVRSTAKTRTPEVEDLQDRIGRLSDLLNDPEIQKIIRSNPSKFPSAPSLTSRPVKVKKAK
jgi:hypothetical protein